MLSMPSQQFKTARSHEEPFAVQFSIFLANRVGQLKELLDVLAERRVQVLGMSVVDSTDWAVIRAVLSDPDKARELLKSRSLPFTESPVLLVHLTDANALSEVCAILLRAEVNVHFAYPLLIRREEGAVMVLHVDDKVIATHALTNHGFVLLGEEDITDPA